jgi:hypothetical protein
MELTIQVDGAQLSEEVKTLLSNLNEEQKQILTKEIISKVLKDSDSKLSISIAKEKALAKMKEELKDSELTINSLEGNGYRVGYEAQDKFRKYVKEFSDIRAIFQDQIVNQMITYGKELVKENVEKSEIVKKAMDTAIAKIQEEMPKIVHDAMIVYFAANMQSMMGAITSAMFQSQSNQSMICGIRDQLQQTVR